MASTSKQKPETKADTKINWTSAGVPKVEGVMPEPVLRANKIAEIANKKKVLNFDTIPLDDKKTWDLICSGFTKGVFQLEKQLGKRYCKEIKPRNLDQLSDVISLIRPGCLEAEFREKPDDPGKFSSITHTYIKIKNGEWEPEFIHPALKPILEDTFSVPIYQEQIMKICTDFAGFTLKEADKMRKAVGKKQSEEVFAGLQKMFVDGAMAQGHDEDIAETIFGWIKKFSGYGFNKSHGIAYALIAYRTAYAKANYPLHFFKSTLANSGSKQDSLEEIQELVHEARLNHIDVKPPNLNRGNVDFIIDGKSICFGLAHIKGVGDGAIASVRKLQKAAGPNDFLKLCFGDKKVRSNVVESLIKSGACDVLGRERILLLAEYKLLGVMTDREKKFVFEKMEDGVSVSDAFKELLESKIPNKTRKPKLIGLHSDIDKSLAGNVKRMRIAYEKYYLGIPLSGSLVELYHNEQVSVKCRDYHRLRPKTKCTLGVVIEKIREIKDRNGNRMCFLTVSDETYMLDSAVVFASAYDKVAWILEEGKPVLLRGQKDARGGLIIRDIQHL